MSIRRFLSSHRASLVAAGLALAFLGRVSPALAVPISTGETIAVSYDQPVTSLPDLTATLDLTVQSITTSQIVLGVDIANTTSPLFTSARLTGIGWDSSVLPTSATDTSTVYSVYLGQNFPANTSVNLCLSSGSTCAGGGSGGLSPSQSNTFIMTLLGNFGTGTIDFSNFAAKFQTAFGSFEPQGTITTGCTGTSCGGGGTVPEPGTLSIFGVGLIASLGYLLARSRNAAIPMAPALA